MSRRFVRADRNFCCSVFLSWDEEEEHNLEDNRGLYRHHPPTMALVLMEWCLCNSPDGGGGRQKWCVADEDWKHGILQ